MPVCLRDAQPQANFPLNTKHYFSVWEDERNAYWVVREKNFSCVHFKGSVDLGDIVSGFFHCHPAKRVWGIMQASRNCLWAADSAAKFCRKLLVVIRKCLHEYKNIFCYMTNSETKTGLHNWFQGDSLISFTVKGVTEYILHSLPLDI